MAEAASGRAPESDEGEPKIIILFVQGHGQTPIPYKSTDTPATTRLSSEPTRLKNVTVLSVVGEELVNSEMGLCFGPEYCHKTNDAWLGTALWQVYKPKHPGPKNKSTDEEPMNERYYQAKLEEASAAIQKVNAAASIHYRDGHSIKQDPVLRRAYFFGPEPHENHRICILKGHDRCIRSRDAAGPPVGPLKHNIVWCPNYGLYALDATDLETHTVASISTPPNPQYPESKFTPAGFIDIRPKNILRGGQYEFWRDKIVANWEGKHDPNDPDDRCESILFLFQQAVKYKELTLEEISTLFQEGMGYTHIQVIDVTCKTPHFEPSPASAQSSQSSSGGSVVGTPLSKDSVYVTPDDSLELSSAPSAPSPAPSSSPSPSPSPSPAPSSPSPAPQGPFLRSADTDAHPNTKRPAIGGSRKSRKRTTVRRKKITRKTKKRVYKKKSQKRNRRK